MRNKKLFYIYLFIIGVVAVAAIYGAKAIWGEWGFIGAIIAVAVVGSLMTLIGNKKPDNREGGSG